MGIDACCPGVGVPDPYFEQIGVYPVLLKDADAAMPKRTGAAPWKLQACENPMQCVSHVILVEGSTILGFKHSPSGSASDVIPEYLSKLWANVDDATPSLGFRRPFLVPGYGTPNGDLTSGCVYILHVKASPFLIAKSRL